MLSIIEQQTVIMKYRDSDKKALKAYFRRSFMLGAGSVLSLKDGSTFLRELRSPLTTGPTNDAEALRGDWNRVGAQLIWAFKSVNK